MTRHRARRRVEPEHARHRAQPIAHGEHEDCSRQRTICSILLTASGGLATAAIAALVLSGGQSPSAAPDGPGAAGERPPADSAYDPLGGAVAELGTTDSPAFAHLTQYGAGQGWRAVPCIGLPGFTWGELELVVRTVGDGARGSDGDRPAGGSAGTGSRAVFGAPRDAGTGAGPGDSAPGDPRTAADVLTAMASGPRAALGGLVPGRVAAPSPGPGGEGPTADPEPTEPGPGGTPPVREPVARVPEPVREPVTRVTEPVPEPVTRVTEPVPEPVARVTEPVREPVEQVVPQAPAVQAPVTPSVTDVLEEGGLLGPG